MSASSPAGGIAQLVRMSTKRGEPHVTAAASAFSVWPTVIAGVERGLQRDDALADRYRTWLNAA